ncbi:hypothetical protein [Polyangium sorediatum]|uniref:Lipoprotein n=1 Tax=Polyangium sorediatum TaxID=889274 RepID=A0ABT6NWI9_9BACT|nr:hypothetical protein [Polyangium sorediatum]MDI1432701.1 hypothetical protein [Polyangium sorediatum]
MRRQYLLIAWVLGFGCASPPAPSSPPPAPAAAPDVPLTPTPPPTSTPSPTLTSPSPPTPSAMKIRSTLGWRRVTPSGIDLFQKLQNGEIRLGMTREEIVRALEHDPLSAETDSDGDWHFHATVNGLAGDWKFDLTSGRLSRLSFEEHRAADENTLGGASPDAHEQAMRDVAAMAHATMKDLTLLFGAPKSVRKGGRVQEDGKSELASRYLLDARWSTPSLRVELSSITDGWEGAFAIDTRILIAPASQ